MSEHEDIHSNSNRLVKMTIDLEIPCVYCRYSIVYTEIREGIYAHVPNEDGSIPKVVKSLGSLVTNAVYCPNCNTDYDMNSMIPVLLSKRIRLS